MAETVLNCKDLLGSIFRYHGLVELGNLRVVSKAFRDVVKGLKLPRIFHERLLKKIEAWGLPSDELCRYLRESGAAIAGSFHLEVMAGANTFAAGDMDIFMSWLQNKGTEEDGKTKAIFPALCRYLYSKSTGEISTAAITLDKKHAERISERVEVGGDENEMPGEVRLERYTDDPVLSSEHHIRHVHAYALLGTNRNIQVIQVELDSETPTIAEYVDKYFDYRCLTTTYDGANYRLRHTTDAQRKQLVVQPSRREIIDEIASTPGLDHARQRRGRRQKKYIDRGFTVIGEPVHRPPEEEKE